MINLTYENITFALGILGVIFTAYNYFRNPQIKTDESLLVLSNKYDTLNALVINLRDNHIHTIDETLKEQNKDINNLALEMKALTTIIDERIPRKLV